MMTEAVWGAIGLVLGLAVGWYWASYRTRPGMVKQLAETKVRGARTVEHLKQEVAAELDRRDRELAELRNTHEHERQDAAKLSADLAHALDQVAHLTEKAEARGTELQHAIDESFREVGQFYEIGGSLERAVEAFTRTIEAVESRLLIASKRLRELGLTIGPPTPAAKASTPETPPPPAVAVPSPDDDAPVESIPGRSKH